MLDNDTISERDYYHYEAAFNNIVAVFDADNFSASDWLAAANWTEMCFVDITKMEHSLFTFGGGEDDTDDADGSARKQKPLQRNRYGYRFGNLFTSPFHMEFLAHSVRERTRRLALGDQQLVWSVLVVGSASHPRKWKHLHNTFLYKGIFITPDALGIRSVFRPNQH